MIEHTVDRRLPLVEAVLRGAVDDDEALRWLTELASDVEELEQVRGLVDTRGLGPLQVTAEGVRRCVRLAEATEDKWSGSRWAIVADSDVVFGMARMYSILRSDGSAETEVFRDVEEARAWLGVSRSGSPSPPA